MEGITISEVQLLNSCFRLEKENNQLREMLRWRCVKKEPPEKKGKYYTVSWNGLPKYDWFYPESGWDCKDWRWTHWRPIGPLPGGAGDE